MDVLKGKFDQMVNWIKELAETLGYNSKPVSKIDRATQMRLKLIKKLEKENKRIVY